MGEGFIYYHPTKITIIQKTEEASKFKGKLQNILNAVSDAR